MEAGFEKPHHGATMDVLLSNDDGIRAPGLRALERALAQVADCWVVAPEREQSAGSHALSLHRPLRARRAGERRWSVSGSPADCIYMGLRHFLPRTPDLVVCGVNRGANLSLDVYYSGTVAAAREAAMWGLPALSVSLHVRDWTTPAQDHHWATAEHYALRVVRDLLERGLPPELLLNLNVPDLPLPRVRGLRAARLGRRHWERRCEARRDIKGRPYYWIGGNHMGFDPIERSDGPSVERDFATLTPLQLDHTAEGLLEELGSWPCLAEPGAGHSLENQ